MNKELIMVFVPAISWLLFALGGTQISSKTGGWKGWRRFILPIFWAITVWLLVSWWQGVLVGVIASTMFHMGYGENTPWWEKALVGLGYAAITLPLGFSWWNAVTFAGFLLLFLLSNLERTSDMFTWKICEGAFGLFCGIQLAYLLMGLGVLWQS